MEFNQNNYKTNRTAVHDVYKKYLKLMQSPHSNRHILAEAREDILSLPYYELLIMQSSLVRWETLMNDPNLYFRRALCAATYNIKQNDIAIELGISEAAVSRFFNEDKMPKYPKPFLISVLLDQPWQLINMKTPDFDSFKSSPEYFYPGLLKQVDIKEINKEREKTRSISGFKILNPQVLFHQETDAIAGRWVTTYPELDYLEFHLAYDPLVDHVLRDAVASRFPQAKYILKTFRPFKPNYNRVFRLIFPKNESLFSYPGMIHELKYRDKTELHVL
ncbi:hypothetical protein AB4Z29_25230 [Paenibacillus sp. 2TAB23]|uniref:hypothetical protein n=1 Tax=Paenibacillus sp. 2TAB23 TaxID=3233004 RepID=UPI003F9E508F